MGKKEKKKRKQTRDKNNDVRDTENYFFFLFLFSGFGSLPLCISYLALVITSSPFASPSSICYRSSCSNAISSAFFASSSFQKGGYLHYLFFRQSIVLCILSSSARVSFSALSLHQPGLCILLHFISARIQFPASRLSLICSVASVSNPAQHTVIATTTSLLVPEAPFRLPLLPRFSISSCLCITSYCLFQRTVMTPSVHLLLITLPYIYVLSLILSLLHLVLIPLKHLWSLCRSDHPSLSSVSLMFLSFRLAWKRLSSQVSLILQVPLLFHCSSPPPFLFRNAAHPNRAVKPSFLSPLPFLLYLHRLFSSDLLKPFYLISSALILR